MARTPAHYLLNFLTALSAMVLAALSVVLIQNDRGASFTLWGQYELSIDRAAVGLEFLTPIPQTTPGVPAGIPAFSAHTVAAVHVALVFLVASVVPTARVAFAAAAWARRRRAALAGRCPHCRYDLTGNESGTCPEYGTKVAKRVTT